MKSLAAFLLLGALAAAPALAAEAGDHASHQGRASATALTQGEIRKVDKAARKLTIRHGAIANLDMPPMTMVFEVHNPALLDQVKVGDKIRFAAEKKDGAFVVIGLEAETAR